MVSDEPRPSAHFRDQRRSDGAPVWWSQLDRGDLPEGPHRPAAVQPTPAPHGKHAAPARHRHFSATWLVNVAALLVALLVVMAAVGVDSARGAAVVALIFGVPMVLVAITVTIAARRAR